MRAPVKKRGVACSASQYALGRWKRHTRHLRAVRIARQHPTLFLITAKTTSFLSHPPLDRNQATFISAVWIKVYGMTNGAESFADLSVHFVVSAHYTVVLALFSLK